VRREANAAADKLVRDAANKNILEKRLAEAAADKLRSEGEANAKKLEQEADQKARAVLAAAQKKADDLKR
jgi:regulator of protease activity HflC (stomatin/prohibitin superfamily)